jgi:hypothetical protein
MGVQTRPRVDVQDLIFISCAWVCFGGNQLPDQTGGGGGVSFFLVVLFDLRCCLLFKDEGEKEEEEEEGEVVMAILLWDLYSLFWRYTGSVRSRRVICSCEDGEK